MLPTALKKFAHRLEGRNKAQPVENYSQGYSITQDTLRSRQIQLAAPGQQLPGGCRETALITEALGAIPRHNVSSRSSGIASWGAGL